MAKQPNISKFWMAGDTSRPTERVRKQSLDVDFADLRNELREIVNFLEPIAVPNDGEWEFILYMMSIGGAWPNEKPYWALHDYPSSNAYRTRAKAFNMELEDAGVRQLATGGAVKEGCPVWAVLRAIEEQKLSSPFIDAWAQLNILRGKWLELQESQPSAEAHRKNARSAGRNSTIGQHVWYACWVVKHAPDLKEDRAAADDGIKCLCGEIISGGRGLPQESKWNRHWFGKLLVRPGGELTDRLTRMTPDNLKRLAEHKWITADLLPPMDVGAYQKTKRASSSHP
jgi:hypothetical protein